MIPPAITAVLGIDQAERSGWGIAQPAHGLAHTFLAHGVARNHAERKAVVQRALECAGGDIRQLLVCFEDHSGMPIDRLTRHDRTTPRQSRFGAPERTTASILGQGAAKGRWEALLDDLGHPATLRDAVEPRVWRRRVLGTAKGTADQLKHLAATWATMRLGEPIFDADEAEGVCITAFAALDGVARLAQRRAAQRTSYRERRDRERQLELDAPPPKLIGRRTTRAYAELVVNDNPAVREEESR